MKNDDPSAKEQARLRRLISAAWSERLPLTFLFLLIGYPFLWRLSVKERARPTPHKPASPFVYTLR